MTNVSEKMGSCWSSATQALWWTPSAHMGRNRGKQQSPSLQKRVWDERPAKILSADAVSSIGNGAVEGRLKDTSVFSLGSPGREACRVRGDHKARAQTSQHEQAEDLPGTYISARTTTPRETRPSTTHS